MTNILIIEDEQRISSFITKGLTAAGIEAVTVSDGLTGRDYALTGDIDLVILDIGLPGLDGFGILDALHESRPNLPVIVLTARDSVTDTVAALEGGAADYMAKPFRFDELLARIRLRLRNDTETLPDLILDAGELTLDFRTREARLAGQKVELSAREFNLLEMFVRHRDEVLSREQLLDEVWGAEVDADSNVVDVYVGYLRRKFGNKIIRTVRGVGFRLMPLTD